MNDLHLEMCRFTKITNHETLAEQVIKFAKPFFVAKRCKYCNNDFMVIFNVQKVSCISCISSSSINSLSNG